MARIARRLTPRVARRVERIRGLEFEQLPEPEVVSAEYLNRLGAREFRRSREPAARVLADDETAARILGLLPADEELDPVVESTGDLAAAAWDTERERLYIVRDAGVGDPALVEFFLAHELTHTLEDQSFGLPEPAGQSDDAALAEISMVEGTATATMLEYSLRHIAPLSLAGALEGIDAGTGDVPRFYVEQLEFSYLGGARWVNALYEPRGDWELVDRALGERPPASTEQILHPEAYRQGDRPLGVDPPAGGLAGGDWTPLDRGELGEFTTAQVLGLGAPEEVAQRAAAGWGGNRYELWRRRGSPPECRDDCRAERALVVAWRWDSATDAEEFAATVPPYAIGGLGGRPDGADAWSLDPGWVALDRTGATTVLAFAPSRGLARGAAAGRP